MLKTIGLWLAKAASYAARGALFVSQHPEVVQAVGAVATLAGHPEAAAIAAEAASVSATVGGVVPVAEAAATAIKAATK